MSDPLLEELQANPVDGICRRGEGFADNIETDDGVIRGRAVPYGHTVELRPGLFEVFERGAFRNLVKGGKGAAPHVKVCYRHEEIIGHMHTFEEREDGLWFEGSISASPDIPEARRARAMIAEGLADEMSVGFQQLPGGTRAERLEEGGTRYTHTRARLLEVSLVPWGAYGREATLSRARLVDPGALLIDARRAHQREWLAEYKARALG